MGLAAILFIIGYALFGVAMIRTAMLPSWSGVLVAAGAAAHLLGFGIAQLVSTAAWPMALFSSVGLGAGLAWRPIGCGTHRLLRICLFQTRRQDLYEHRIFGARPSNARRMAHRVRAIIFRVVAALAGLFLPRAGHAMPSAVGVAAAGSGKARN
jgi:hypothetical protein